LQQILDFQATAMRQTEAYYNPMITVSTLNELHNFTQETS